jgi:predicted methyltransferase
MTRPLYRRPRAIGMLASLSILAGSGAVSAMAQNLKTLLRHPEDPRDAAVFRPQIPTDEFVLKYQKPL